MDEWQRSHQRWFHELDLQLAKRNHALGLDAEDDEVKNVPYELRHLVPFNPNTHMEAEGLTLPADAAHPADTFFAKLTLDRLTGHTSPEPDPTNWLDKLLESLSPAQHRTDPGRLEKRVSADALTRMRKLFADIGRNAEFAGVAIERSEWEPLRDAMDKGDENVFCQLAERVLTRVRHATAALAA